MITATKVSEQTVDHALASRLLIYNNYNDYLSSYLGTIQDVIPTLAFVIFTFSFAAKVRINLVILQVFVLYPVMILGNDYID